MKGIIRIGGALVFGIVIILGAFSVSDQKTVSGGEVVALPAPTRTYIETGDSDRDGIKDWQASLGNAFTTIDTPTSTSVRNTDEEYTPPSTFTGRFSEAFFEDYLKGKIRNEELSDPMALVGNAVTAIEENTQSKRYSRLDIIIEPTTGSGIYEYGNKIAGIIQKHSITNENELVILDRALTNEEPQILEALKPIEEVYARTIEDTLRTPVPTDLVAEHIALLNAYEAIRTDLNAMQLAFTDPLYALARTKGYEDDARSLNNAFKAMGLKLTSSGATYSNTEPGAFFYLFDL